MIESRAENPYQLHYPPHISRRRDLMGTPARVVFAALAGMGTLALSIVATVKLTEAEMQTYTSSWSQTMSNKLLGRSKLAPDETYLRSVEVVPSGRSYLELLQMKKDGTPVNVRKYPGHFYPNGGGTEVVGQLAQGAIIYDVIIIEGRNIAGAEASWAAFNCNSVSREGWVTKSPKIDSGEVTICAIFGSYVS